MSTGQLPLKLPHTDTGMIQGRWF